MTDISEEIINLISEWGMSGSGLAVCLFLLVVLLLWFLLPQTAKAQILGMVSRFWHLSGRVDKQLGTQPARGRRGARRMSDPNDEYGATWVSKENGEADSERASLENVAPEVRRALELLASAVSGAASAGSKRDDRLVRVLESVERRMSACQEAISQACRAGVAILSENLHAIQRRETNLDEQQRRLSDFIGVYEKRVKRLEDEATRFSNGLEGVDRQRKSDLETFEIRLAEATTAIATGANDVERVLSAVPLDAEAMRRLAVLLTAISLLPRSERFDQAFKVISTEMGYTFCEASRNLDDGTIGHQIERLRQWLADQGIHYSFYVPRRGEGYDPKTHDPVGELSAEKCMGKTVAGSVCWGIQHERGKSNISVVARAKVSLE